jgi:putative peptidoglycan lipid II flippase
MSSQDGLARSTSVVSGATLVSRLFGLAREQTFAFLFGAGFATDAFVAAFRIPNLLRDLFAEGALSAAFIPVFTETLTHKGKPEAYQLANRLASLLTVVLAVVVGLGILVTPFIVRLIAPGFQAVPGKAELTTTMARLMFPFLFLVSMAAVAMGMLNSLRRFAVPAFAPVLFNLALIAAGFLLSPYFHPPIVGMALGVLIGGLGQWAIQIPLLHREGFTYRFELSFTDPGVRRILWLITPAIVGLASTQLGIFVNTQIASLLPQGSVSYLNYSFRLMAFPLGIFGVAVATVTLPIVSAYAARKETDKILSAAGSSLKLIFFLTIPSIFFLCFAARPIISVLFQHGRFTPEATIHTARALVFYSFGLFAYSSIRVVAPIFYALGDTKTPAGISVIAVAVAIVLNLTLRYPLGYRGLALATSIAAMTNLILLVVRLTKRVGRLDFRDLTRSFVKVLVCSLVLTIAVVGAGVLWRWNPKAGLGPKVAHLAYLFLAAAGSYVLAASALGIREMKQLLGLLTRRRA